MKTWRCAKCGELWRGSLPGCPSCRIAELERELLATENALDANARQVVELERERDELRNRIAAHSDGEG